MTDLDIFSGRTLIVGFDGWSDSADAASGAARFMALSSGAELVGLVDPEDFYDFQVNRPMISVDDSLVRSVNWPSTQVY